MEGSKSKSRQFRSLSGIFKNFSFLNPNRFRPRHRLSIADYFRPHHVYRDSFHRAIYPIIFVAQIFSLMPVEGISASSPTLLQFRLHSIRTIYANLFALLSGIILIFEIFLVISSKNATAKSVAGVLFFFVTTSAHFFFIYIAKSWRGLMLKWSENESVFLKFPYYKDGRRLRRKIRIFGGVFLVSSLVEHVLSRVSNFYNYEFERRTCNWTIHDTLEFYSVRDFNQIFRFFLPYHWTVGIFLYYFNGLLTFTWNFTDLFIISVGFGLAERFQQMNEHLMEVFRDNIDENPRQQISALSHEPMKVAQTLSDAEALIVSFQMENIEFWKRIRWHYGLICEIVETFNTSISFIIILSCLNNLYFICLQVLNVTIQLPHMVNFVYFWFSLVFLILRTVSVFLSSAEVNEQAIKPLEIIRHLPNAYWNIEVERLANQIRCETVAISGMKFFNMTRRLLFGMLGTIITYEIVLMQFDTSDQTPKSLNCDRPPF